MSTFKGPLSPGRISSGRIPDGTHWDCTLPFFRDPYHFIGGECALQRSEVFTSRLLLQPTIFMTGPRAAEVFSDPELFQRSGAAPEPLQATLFGKGGVQGLDGAQHRHRKAMFMRVLSAEGVASLADLASTQWQRSTAEWAQRRQIDLYRASQTWLARSAFGWAGIPLRDEHETALRTRHIALLFDQAVSPWQHLRVRWARWRCEAWLAALVRDARLGRIALRPGSAAEAVSAYRGPDGKPLEPRIAAVELLNLVRPIVAVSVYVAFAGHALHAYPSMRALLGDRGPRRDRFRDAFVQEVRRHYPFFPAVAARVRKDFTWDGVAFPQGQRAILDLYGTNHDVRCWDEPWEFRPERFLHAHYGPYAFVPQGGGDPARHHRCPGEQAAMSLLALAVDGLTQQLDYCLPAQDSRLDFGRAPGVPRSGMVLAGLRARG